MNKLYTSVMSPHPLTPLLATGLSGMVGSRFQTLYQSQYSFQNLDLATGVDITRADQVMEAVKASPAQVVLHLAAFTNVSAAFEQTDDKQGSCYQVNVTGTQNVAAACKAAGKYLIHVSTDFIFDGTKTEPYVETDTPHPIEWYGQTKYWAEEAVLTSLSRYAVVRLAYPYQARPVRPDFLAGMREKLANNTMPPAFADHTITPTFVDDVAKVFDFCAREQPQGIYHMVGSSWHTDYEMALMVKNQFGLPGEVREGSLTAYLQTAKRPYQQTMKVSNQKLQHDFGINMKTFAEGLQAIG